MRIRVGHVICAVACILAHTARAGDEDLDVSSQPKKIEDKITGQHSEEVSKTEKWGYSVTVENNTFQPLTNLEVKYMIFYKKEELGVKGPPRKRHDDGTYGIPLVAANDKVTFDTGSVELTKSTLLGPVGGYSYFSNGAKPSAQDSLTGVWIRIYQNGQLFKEYANPSDIMQKEQWEE